MNKNAVRWVILMGLIIVVGACVKAGPTNGGKFAPVPRSAYDVRHHVLARISGYQTDYKISAIFPNKDVAKFYKGMYSINDWRQCGGSGDWLQLVKRTGDKFLPTQQYLEEFYSAKQNKVLVVMLQYYGQIQESTTKLPIWNYSVQHTTVILYQLKEKNKHNESLRCEKTRKAERN